MNSSSAGEPGQAEPEFHLSARQVADLFPFHVVFDREMRVCQVGHSLAKVLPELCAGTELTGRLGLERPSIPFTFDSILAHSKSLFLVVTRQGNLRLRGQMLSLPELDRVAFLCSPWLPEPGEFRTLGLTYDDFPLHDSMPEFMNVVQSQRLAMEDLRKFGDKLRQQREALKQANQKLVFQSAEAKKLALIAARTENGVIVTDAQGRVEWVNRAFEQITGFTLDEVRGSKPGSLLQGPGTDPATVRYIRSQLAKGEGFTCELVNYRKDGRKYWIGIEVQPIHDASGNITNFMAIESDITDRKDAEFRRNLAYAVTGILAEATDMNRALSKILQTIVEALGYEFGVVWRLDPATRKLSPFRIWSPPHLKGSSFEAATRQSTFKAGEGLPGTVLSLNGAFCIVDLRDTPNFPRRAAAEQDNLRSGFAFPIQVAGEARGVMEFFSRESGQPNEELLHTLTGLGNHIGQFMERQDAESERRRLVSLLNSTLESTSDGVVVVDTEQRFVAWNRRFLEIWDLAETGIPDPEHPDRERVIPRMVANSEEFVRRLQWWYSHPNEAGNDVIHFRDGRVFSRVTQPHWMDGQIVGRIWSYRDVTEGWIAEQALRESEERYRVISATASDGILTVNRLNQILFANEAAERIFCYPSGQLTGRFLSDLMGSEYLAMSPKALAQVVRRSLIQGHSTEIVGRRSDGQEIPLEVSFGKSHVRGERVITGIFRDITERRRAEERLLQAMRETDLANRAKSDFLASMSHEMRTPLNSIAGLAELLRDTALDDNQRDMINTVWSCSESLLNLINDLLDFSKIEAGQMENAAAPFDPLVACERAVEIANSRACQKGLALVCTATPDFPPLLLGDANRISQILLNLVVNGVKFTEAGSVIVEMQMTRLSGGRARVDYLVHDTGIGIRAEDRERVFEKFYRVDTQVGRRAGGTGLGLSIGRLLAEGMGGTLTLEPERDRGSCFRLSLELPVVPKELQPAPVRHIRGVAVLLSANENTAMLTKAWHSVGLEVISFDNLISACEYLDADRPCDLAVLDGTVAFEGAELKRFFRLLSLRGRSRCIRIRPPQIGGNSPGEMSGQCVTIDFPLTPSRMRATLHRLLSGGSTAPSAGEESDVPTTRSESGPSLRILLVEDNPDSQAYAARVFHKAGHHVTIAESVAGALRSIETRRFDIVFMDVMLPDGNGFDAARAIRRHEQSAGLERTPLIALTANAMKEYRDRAFDADMDDYLTKPVRPDALLMAVRKWSRQKQDARSLPEAALKIDPGMADLVPAYLARAAKSAEEIVPLTAAGNWERIRTIGHDLKGSGAAYGFPEITRLGKAIEIAGREGKATEAAEAAAMLAGYLARVRWVAAPE